MTDPSHTQASESAAADSHADALAQRYGAKPVRQRALSTRMWVLLAACITVVVGTDGFSIPPECTRYRVYPH